MVNNNAKLITETKDCKYRLPCGWCDRLNEICIFERGCEAIKPSKNQDNDFIREVLNTQIETPAITCPHNWELMNSVNTAGVVYRCALCGAIKTEPFNYPINGWITVTNNEESSQNSIWKSLNETPNACKNCPNHPSNGGSGFCNCTLGQPKITCSTAANNMDGEIK